MDEEETIQLSGLKYQLQIDRHEDYSFGVGSIDLEGFKAAVEAGKEVMREFKQEREPSNKVKGFGTCVTQ